MKESATGAGQVADTYVMNADHWLETVVGMIAGAIQAEPVMTAIAMIGSVMIGPVKIGTEMIEAGRTEAETTGRGMTGVVATTEIVTTVSGMTAALSCGKTGAEAGVDPAAAQAIGTRMGLPARTKPVRTERAAGPRGKTDLLEGQKRRQVTRSR